MTRKKVEVMTEKKENKNKGLSCEIDALKKKRKKKTRN
jgi:hypothetical protein